MNPKITDYTVLSKPNHEDLQKEVLNLIKKGWQPLGGATVIVSQEVGWCADITLFQTMVKYGRLPAKV